MDPGIWDMGMWPLRRVLKYVAVGGALLGTAASLKANQYHLDLIGIVRMGRAATTVFSIALYYKMHLNKPGLDHNSPEYEALKSEAHQMGAERLLELCRSNRGVWVKVGQHVGALDYILPQEYVKTMKVLHSHAPSSSVTDVFRVIREDLKVEPCQLFSEFDPEPLGAASLAQVHKAKLADGHVVAVKVQHANVRGNSIVDMKIMEVLVNLVSMVFSEFKMKWLVEETKKNIPVELDFGVEVENMEKVRVMFRHFPWLKVPHVHAELCSSRVIIMEYVEGGQVNDLEYIQASGINVYDVANKLGMLYSQMIFNTGFVHSDPHPGNILVHRSHSSTDIILLDHGLYATLSDTVRCEYAKLWLSILNKDKAGMKDHCTKLGVGDFFALFSCMITGRTWDAIESGLESTRFTVAEKRMFQKEVPGLLPLIAEILSRVNSQLLLILKTNDLIRGIEHTLQTQNRMTAFLVMSRCCVHSVYTEQMQQCKSHFSRWRNSVEENWVLFKINLYYVYLYLHSLSFGLGTSKPLTPLRHSLPGATYNEFFQPGSNSTQ